MKVDIMHAEVNVHLVCKLCVHLLFPHDALLELVVGGVWVGGEEGPHQTHVREP